MRGRERDIETERKTNGQRDRWKHTQRGGGRERERKLKYVPYYFFKKA